jgi:LuxR family quorum sensing-dependent transcriptional regulator
MDQRGAIATAFIERHPSGGDLEALIADFQQLVRDFGFAASAGGAWIGAGAGRTSRFFFNDWPADWIAQYVAGNFGERDPIVIEAHRRIEPFLWSEMLEEPSFKIEGAEVWAAGQAYGWVEGFSVPIHGPGGYQALVSLAALKPVALSIAERRMLQAVALHVHDECRRGIDPLVQRLPALSARQIECLHWVAAGKTDAEIAKLLGITAATVHYHVEGAKRQLGLRSRSQAVAALVLHGLI